MGIAAFIVTAPFAKPLRIQMSAFEVLLSNNIKQLP
jgi:hypothetical protein